MIFQEEGCRPHEFTKKGTQVTQFGHKKRPLMPRSGDSISDAPNLKNFPDFRPETAKILPIGDLMREFGA